MNGQSPTSHRSSPLFIGILVTVLIILPALLQAQDVGEWIPVPTDKPHPRILFDRSEIQEIRDFARTNPDVQPLVEDVLTTARKWVDRPIDLPDESVSGIGEPPNDAREYHARLRSPTRDLALAYVLTGEDGFAAKAGEILLKYAEKYPTYAYAHTQTHSNRPAHANVGKLTGSALGESSFAKDFALAYDWIAGSDVLSETEKAKIERDLLRELYRTMETSRTFRKGGKPIEWPNNSNHGAHRNEAIAFLGYTLGDEAMVNSTITGPLGFIMQTHTIYNDNGYLHEEAPGYHFYALAGHLGIAEAALNNGLNLYKGVPEIKTMFEIPRYVAMPDGYLPPIGDSSTRPLPAGDYALAWLRYSDDRFADVAAGHSIYDSRSALYLLFERFDPASLSDPNLPAPSSRNFEEAGMGILRSGGTDSLYTLLLYGPHGGNHGHRDKLSVLLHGAGAMLGYDERPHYRSHWRNSWFRQTFAHNTVTVDEKWQRPSRGQSEGFLATPFLQLSAAAADSAYPNVRHARNVLMIEDRYVVIVDALHTDRKRTFDWVYRSPGQFTRNFPIKPQHGGNLPPYRVAGGQLSAMKHVRESPPVASWRAVWDQGPAALHVTMPDGSDSMKVYTGHSPRYAHHGEQAHEDGLIWDLPMIFARKTGRSALFTAVLDPVRSGDSPLSDITLHSNTFPLEITVRLPDGTNDRITLTSPRDVTPPGQLLKSDLMAGAGEEMGTDIIAGGASNSINLRRPDVNSRATLVRRTDDEISAIAGLDAWHVQAGEIGLSFAPQTSFSLQRVPSGWILTHTGQEGVQITLNRAFEDMHVIQKGADRPLITTKHEGTQTFVLDDNQEYMIRPSEADKR